MPLPHRSPRASACFYALAAAAAAAAAGCGKDAASSNRRAPEDRFDPAVVLSGERARDAERAMGAATAGHGARPLEVDPAGRWSDVPMAVRNVAGKWFVGVRAFDTSADRIVARTSLEDGQPGTVTATRDPAGAISVRCELSTFPDPARDGRFAAEVAAELRRLGSIPRPAPR